MRREKAGWVTWRNCAERLKLRVSARLTKSSSHLVSMAADYARRAWAAIPLFFRGLASAGFRYDIHNLGLTLIQHPMTQNPPAIHPSRIAHEGLRQKIMSADAAAA